jgi:hypothetical protein
MTDEEFASRLEGVIRHLRQQYEVTAAVVRHFIALTVAVTPVMLACRDAEALEAFRLELLRLNKEVGTLLKDADEMVTH